MKLIFYCTSRGRKGKCDKAEPNIGKDNEIVWPTSDADGNHKPCLNCPRKTPKSEMVLGLEYSNGAVYEVRTKSYI